MGSGASTLQEYDALPSDSKKAIFDKVSDELNKRHHEAAANQVFQSPFSYDLTVTGHVMEICNGLYRPSGDFEDRVKWVKFGATIRVVFEGGPWEFIRRDMQHEDGGGPVAYGSFPPTRPDSWDRGSLASDCTIRIEYVKRPMSSAIGTWVMLEDMYPQDLTPSEEGYCHLVVEECRFDDLEELEELKAKVVAKNWSAMFVKEEESVQFIDVDYPLKPEHCRPMTEWGRERDEFWRTPESTKLFIYTPPPELTKLGQKSVEHQGFDWVECRRLILIKKPEVTEPFFNDEVFAAVEAGQEFLARPIAIRCTPVRLEDPNRQLLALGVGRDEFEDDDFITLRFDKSGGFLKWKDGFCLEVSGYEENSKVYLVQGDPTSKDTRRPERSRSFTIERASAGGCLISPVHAPHLQLGARKPAWSQPDWSQEMLPEDLVNMRRAFTIYLPQHDMSLVRDQDGYPVSLVDGDSSEPPWFIPFWNERLYACAISSSADGCMYSLRLRHPRPGAPLVVRQQKDSYFWFRPEKQEGDCFRLKALVNIDPQMEELQSVMAKFKKIKNDEGFFMEFNEFASALTSMNPKLSDQDVSKAFARVDTNKDGKIDLYEYLKMVKVVGKGIPLDPDLYLVYRDLGHGEKVLVACEDATEASLFRFLPSEEDIEGVDAPPTPR